MSDANALVSVVIPTIGRPSLVRAIQSVKSQIGVSIDLIVVLDRPSVSEDVERMVDGAGRLLLTEGGAGGSAARNMGVLNARGEFVAFLDDDDWWDRAKLHLQVTQMAGTGATWAWSGARFMRGPRSSVLPRRMPTAGESLASYVVQRPSLRYGDGFIQSSSLLLTAPLARRVLWDATLTKHQDWDLIARLDDPELGSWTVVEEPMVCVEQQRDGSVSRTRSWHASMLWFDRHRFVLSPRSRGDFVASQVLRSALATMDVTGIRLALVELAHNRPNPAAAIVGLSGLVEYTRGRFSRLRSVAMSVGSGSR